MIDFNINNWRKKHVLKEGVGGVVSRNPFGKMTGMFRTEAVDNIDDKEAAQDYDDLEDKDIDNDGDTDASDSYLHKKLGTVAKKDEGEEEMTDEACNIKEWQDKWLTGKHNMKWG